MMSHENLQSYYSLNSLMTDELKFSLSDVHDMLPYEREIYIDFFVKKREKQNRS